MSLALTPSAVMRMCFMYISLKPSRFHTHPFGSTCQADIDRERSVGQTTLTAKSVWVSIWRRIGALPSYSSATK